MNAITGSGSIVGSGEKITAKIGSGVNKEALNGVVFSLGREGAEALRKGDYETALDRFTACCEVNEKICKKDDVNYGASLHNMATALHYLGKLEQAELYYEKAKAVFEKQAAGPFRPTQKHRIKFIEERLTLLRFGGKPSSETYIDEYGVERPTLRRDFEFDNPHVLAQRAEKQYWKGVTHAKNKIWSLAQVGWRSCSGVASAHGLLARGGRATYQGSAARLSTLGACACGSRACRWPAPSFPHLRPCCPCVRSGVLRGRTFTRRSVPRGA